MTSTTTHRLTTGLLLSRTTKQLQRIAFQADLDVHNRHRVYPGLTRAQTVIAAQHRRTDALTVLAHKRSVARASSAA